MVQVNDVVIREVIVVMAMLKGRVQLLLEFRECLADFLEKSAVVVSNQTAHRVTFDQRHKVEGGVHGGVYSLWLDFLYIGFAKQQAKAEILTQIPELYISVSISRLGVFVTRQSPVDRQMDINLIGKLEYIKILVVWREPYKSASECRRDVVLTLGI
jgi:hypothetical protein